MLQVQPKGRAASQGIMAGDRVVAICGVPTHNKTHAEIKSEMLRAGNDLDVTVVRYRMCYAGLLVKFCNSNAG